MLDDPAMLPHLVRQGAADAVIHAMSLTSIMGVPQNSAGTLAYLTSNPENLKAVCKKAVSAVLKATRAISDHDMLLAAGQLMHSVICLAAESSCDSEIRACQDLC